MTHATQCAPAQQTVVMDGRAMGGCGDAADGRTMIRCCRAGARTRLVRTHVCPAQTPDPLPTPRTTKRTSRNLLDREAAAAAAAAAYESAFRECYGTDR